MANSSRCDTEPLWGFLPLRRLLASPPVPTFFFHSSKMFVWAALPFPRLGRGVVPNQTRRRRHSRSHISFPSPSDMAAPIHLSLCLAVDGKEIGILHGRTR